MKAIKCRSQVASSWKVRHASRQEAERAVCRMFEGKGRRLVILKCDFCGGYHTAHIKPGRKEAERQH